jgi:hypothetical protein
MAGISGSTSSVTRNSTGDYTINFTSAMPDTNYVVNISRKQDSSGGMSYCIGGISRTAGAVSTSASGFGTVGSGFAGVDYEVVTVTIIE